VNGRVFPGPALVDGNRREALVLVLLPPYTRFELLELHFVFTRFKKAITVAMIDLPSLQARFASIRGDSSLALSSASWS
jgi:hypothetical protein